MLQYGEVHPQGVIHGCAYGGEISNGAVIAVMMSVTFETRNTMKCGAPQSFKG